MSTTSLLFSYSYSLLHSSSSYQMGCCCCFHRQHFLIRLWKCAASHLSTLFIFCLPRLAFVPATLLYCSALNSFNISLHQLGGNTVCLGLGGLFDCAFFQFPISCLTFNLSFCCFFPKYVLICLCSLFLPLLSSYSAENMKFSVTLLFIAGNFVSFSVKIIRRLAHKRCGDKAFRKQDIQLCAVPLLV